MKPSALGLCALLTAFALSTAAPVRAQSRPNHSHAADPRAKGIGEMAFGLILIPLGLIATLESAPEKKCERDGIISSFETCSESGPGSPAGQMLGGGLMVSGIVMMAVGAGNLTTHP